MISMNNLQKSIVRILQQKKVCSRKELSSLLSVTPAAITLATGPLLDSGYIQSLYEVNREKAGRKEVMLSVNPHSFFSIGIDINEECITLIKMNASLEMTELFEFSYISELVDYMKVMELSNCVGISVSLKSFYSLEHADEVVQKLFEFLKTLNENVTIINNIAALAYAHKMHHPEDESFALIKYGPGVGSALFIQNKLLSSKTNPTYELGKIYLDDGLTTVEEAIGYKTIAPTKSEAVALLKENKTIQENTLKVLARTIYNVNTLLQLDKVLVSGDIFKDDVIFERLLAHIPMSQGSKSRITRMSDYAELNRDKAALTAQYSYFDIER